MNHRLPGLLLAASLLGIAASLWMRDRLPERAGVLPQLLDEPRQSELRQPAFEAHAGGVAYTVQPLHRYEIHGLVVSRHDTSAWWDILHRKDWNDHLNVADLCVIWGPNLRDDNFRSLRYRSEVFTCHVGTNSDQVWRRFDENALSNNHLLANDPRVVERLRGVRPGDQVRIAGYLAEYSHEHGRSFRRGTSTVRNDRGDGACETVWVTEAQVLRAANRGWRALLPASVVGVLLAVLWWWWLPVPPPRE